MKTFVFLIFSVLIHCCIFGFPFLRNSQDSLISGLFLSNFKTSKSLKYKPTAVKGSSKQAFEVKELKLSPPKNLNKKAVSKLNYRDGLIYRVQSKTAWYSKIHNLKKVDSLVLNITLNTLGSVTAYHLHEKSKYSYLNTAALKALKSFKSYKPLPKDLRPQATFLVPVHFH